MRARTVVSACALIKRANFVCRFRRAVGPGTYWLAERRLNRDPFVGEALAVLPITTNDAPQTDDVLDGVKLRPALLRHDQQLGEGTSSFAPCPSRERERPCAACAGIRARYGRIGQPKEGNTWRGALTISLERALGVP